MKKVTQQINEIIKMITSQVEFDEGRVDYEITSSLWR